jgi:chemotaxis signal transduction protein
MTAESVQLLIFEIGTSAFSVPLTDVTEVLCEVEPRKLPHSPSHFLGIASLRNSVFPVVDFSQVLGLTSQDVPSQWPIVLLIESVHGWLGFKVDKVLSVFNFVSNEKSTVIPKEFPLPSECLLHVHRWREAPCVCLDLKKIANTKDLAWSLQQMQRTA